MFPQPILAFTLLELLLVLAIIAALVAAFLPQLRRWWSGRGPPPGPGTTPIPYPPLPTGATPGGIAAAGVAQGRFTDGHVVHRRLTTQTYILFRYEHHYLLTPSDRPKQGVVFNIWISTRNAGDNPTITGTSATTGSQIVAPQYAIVVTDAAGEARIDVQMPSGEFSNPNTLIFTVEEVGAGGAIQRRVIRDDVAITPP